MSPTSETTCMAAFMKQAEYQFGQESLQEPYILPCNRAIYNQFVNDATCNVCGDADETPTHFLLECEAQQACRQPIVSAIEAACDSLCDDLGICTFKVANHVVSMIGFTDLQDQCSDITGKENCSYLS